MGIYDRDYYRRETSGSLWLTGRTPVTLGLVIANVAVSIALAPWAFEMHGGWLGRVLDLVPSKVFVDFQVWRLLSATFCHAGVWHLFWNMLFLWWFGRELEMLYGSREFLIFYLVSAVLSSLGWAAVTWMVDPDSNVPMVGASGAVAAVAVLYTLYNPRQPIQVFGMFTVELWLLVLVYLASDFYGLMGRGDPFIAHTAHLAGAIYAVIYKYADLRASRLLARRLVRPRLRVHRPELEEEEPAQPQPSSLDEALEHRMDEVLAKIAREGPQSLTDQERQILDEASRRLRNRRG